MNESDNKRKIRLVGLDLDGTTLTTQKELTDHTKDVIEACLKKGIQVLPATGRVKIGIPDYLKKIKGIRYILTSNGSSIVDLQTDKMIYENCITWERALELFEILEGYDTFYDAYSMGCGWCEPRFYNHLDNYKITPPIKTLIRTTRKTVDNLPAFIREHKQGVEKINMFFSDPKKRQRVFEELSAIPDIKVTCSLENNLEINHYSCNKGEALLFLGKFLGIAPEEIMACGDGNNDIEMIRNAGIGVAMENGVAELKKEADFVTKTNDEEGVAFAMEYFCLTEGK